MMPTKQSAAHCTRLTGHVLGRLANQEPVPGGVFSFYLDLTDGKAACDTWLSARLADELAHADISERSLLAAAYETARAAVAFGRPACEGSLAVFVAPGLAKPLLGAVASLRPLAAQIQRLQRPQLAPLLAGFHDPGRFRLLCLHAGAWSLLDVDGECSRSVVSVKPRTRLKGRFGHIPVQVVRRAAADLDGRRLVVAGAPGERESILSALPRRLAMRVATYVGLAASAPLADALAAAREELETRHQLHVTLETHRVATMALGRRAATGLAGVSCALESARAGRIVVAQDYIEELTQTGHCGDSDAERLAEAVAHALRQRVPMTVTGPGVLDQLGGIACTLASPRERHERPAAVAHPRLGLVA